MTKIKLIKELENKGFEILENNIISDKHLDCLWYQEQGVVLRFKYRGVVYSIEAFGDIKIYNKKGNLIYDGKERNEGFNFKLKDDKSLKNIGSEGDNKNYWYDNNNWFEILCDKWDEGIIIYSLDELKNVELEEQDELSEMISEKLEKIR